MGCVEAIELSEDEGRLVSRYAAGRILNYSEQSDGRLTPPWITAAPVQPPDAADYKTPAPGEVSDSGNQLQSAAPLNPSQNADLEEPVALEKVTLSELFDIMGIKVSYHTHEFCKQYPKGTAYGPIAGQSETLLAVKFKLKNTSSRAVSVNISKMRRLQYLLAIQNQTYSPEQHILGVENVLNSLRTGIKAGKSIDAVLIYTLPNRLKNADDIILNMQNNNKEAEVIIK